MVKNINAFHLTEKIRFGRNTSETQPENTIVLNASANEIENPQAHGFYVTPIRHIEGSSNVLMYDYTKNEIVFGNEFSLQGITELGSSSNVKTHFKHLEVEQLDVINVTQINNYYIENPEFVIGQSDRTLDEVSLKFIKGNANVSISYDGELHFNSDVVKTRGSLSADTFIGDGGLLSNLSYEQLGHSMKELHVSNDVHASKYHGDGSLLTGIKLEQISNTTSDSLTMKSASICEDVIIGNTLFVNGMIQSEKNIYAKSFIGNGRTLSGVALTKDLISNVSRIESLEQLKPEVEKIVAIEEKLPKIYILENTICDHEHRISETEKLEERFSKLEYIPNVINTHSQHISTLVDTTNELSPLVHGMNRKLVIVDDTEKRVSNLEINQLRFNPLENKTKVFETYLPRIHTLEGYVPIIKTVDTLIPNIRKYDTYIPRIETTERIIPRVNHLELFIPKINTLEAQIPRFEPLEALVSNIHSSEQSIHRVESQLPSLHEKVTVLESKPCETIQSVLSRQSNTYTTIQSEHPTLAMTTVGNIGVGTTEAPVRVSIYEDPNILTEMGEVRAIKINNLVQINAYTKANNGTTSGRPGGLVIKTKRPNGDLQESMTVDGNGCVTIGSNKSYTSAALTVDSTSRGLLLPRMTLEQIQKIKKPEPGLMVYNTDDDEFWGYKRSGWTKLY